MMRKAYFVVASLAGLTLTVLSPASIKAAPLTGGLRFELAAAAAPQRRGSLSRSGFKAHDTASKKKLGKTKR